LNNNPLISIVIPYYNRPEKLIRCVNSIKNQTYNNYEIIIVDDCSETIFPDLNCNHIYIKNDINKGPGASRNAGMDVAKGEFIAFLDSDDYWDKNFLVIMTNELVNCNLNKVIFAYCNTLNFDGSNKKAVKRSDVIFHTTVLPNILIDGRSWSTPGCLWNRKLIGFYRFQELYNWEDYCFEISIAKKYNEILPVEDCLVYCDSSGKDKLSKQAFSKIVQEKSKALNYIIKQLEYTAFFNLKLKNRLMRFVLSNCIQAQYHIISRKEIFNRNLQSIKILNGHFYASLISLILKLNKRISLGILSRIKNNL
jgi:glycosyltransferase involved in cell wall biosynthesis